MKILADVSFPDRLEGKVARLIFAYLDEDNYQCLEFDADFSAGCTLDNNGTYKVGDMLVRVIERAGGGETVLKEWQDRAYDKRPDDTSLPAEYRYIFWTYSGYVKIGNDVLDGQSFDSTIWHWKIPLAVPAEPYTFGLAVPTNGPGGVEFELGVTNVFLGEEYLQQPRSNVWYDFDAQQLAPVDLTTLPKQVQVDLPASFASNCAACEQLLGGKSFLLDLNYRDGDYRSYLGTVCVDKAHGFDDQHAIFRFSYVKLDGDYYIQGLFVLGLALCNTVSFGRSFDNTTLIRTLIPAGTIYDFRNYDETSVVGVGWPRDKPLDPNFDLACTFWEGDAIRVRAVP